MQTMKQYTLPLLSLAVVLMGVVIATTPKPAAAQAFDFSEFHTWTDVATIYKFGDTFRYDGDYGIRGLLTGDDWTLIYLRPSVRYKDRPWLRLHGGMALFYNFLKDVEDLPELRPWVGVRFAGPTLGGWTISNYFRLEYRAFYLKGTGEWDEVWRGRWQLQVTTPDFAIGGAERFYALASIEPFQDFGTSFNPFQDFGSTFRGEAADRIRTNIGIGNKLTPALRIDLNYLFHSRRVSEGDRQFDVDDHVVRLRFFYTFN